MAQNDGRRAVVGDPLAVSGREVRPDRSLALSGIRGPSNGGPSSAGGAAEQMSQAFGALGGAYAGYIEANKDTWITEGKMAYMSGKTEADLLANGNRFTREGYSQLKVRDNINKWYMDEAAGIDQGANRENPEAYQQSLREKRSTYLDGITDPYEKKIATAAFEEYSPELAQSQFAKNNEFERGQRINTFGELLSSTSQTSRSRSVVDENVPLKLSSAPVGPVMAMSVFDRDAAIRTVLGEAANQGSTGQAAVAHVLRNRAVDGRWPKSIAGVAKQPQQFSAWNSGAGGNHLVNKYKPGDAMYEKTGKIVDAVMSGRHVDPTGGATHYYSPAGMAKHIRDGDQSHSEPKWLAGTARESGGTTKIGGHIFAGRASMPQTARAAIEMVSAPQIAPESATNGTGNVDPNTIPTPDEYIAQAEAERAGSPLVAALNEVPAEEGVEVTGITEVGSANEIQELIHGYEGLNPNDKATAVATHMATQLENGDDTLFRDGGGVATLMQLGATPAEIAKVKQAEVNYQKSQLDAYDSEGEVWRSDLMKKAETGTSLEEVLAEIDARVQSKQLDDREAQSLARSAAASVRGFEAEGPNLDGNVDYLQEIGGLYQQINAGTADFADAAAEAKRIGEKYGADEKEVNQVVGNMFSLDQAQQNKDRADAAAAAKKYGENEQVKGTVNAALARGAGLDLLTGTVDTVNAAGQKATVPAKEYGVSLIRDKHIQNWKAKQESGDASVSEAIAGTMRDTFMELQQHQIIDKETQAQLVGALSGPITEKDGSLSEDALQAYDAWLILKNTPEIKDGYLAATVGDPEVRSLLETAYVLEAGNLTGGRALRRAHEILADPLRDPEARISKDAIWSGKLDKGVAEIIDGKTYTGNIFNPSTLSRTAGARAMSNADRAETFVRNRAEAYHMNAPQQDAQVSLKLALQDLENNSAVVGGNLIITPNETLSERMGIQQFGADAPDAAIQEYLIEYGADIWGEDYKERQYRLNDRRGQTGLRERDTPFHLTYNQSSGTVSISLYKDEEKGILLGTPRVFDVTAIGADYKRKQSELTGWDNMWNSIYAAPKKFGERVRQMEEGEEIPTQLPPIEVMDAIKPLPKQ